MWSSRQQMMVFTENFIDLASARWEHDDASRGRLLPGGDGLGLVWERRPLTEDGEGLLRVRARLVDEREAAARELRHDRAIVVRRRRTDWASDLS